HGSTAADPHDAMLRVSRLPLVRSAVQTVISAYSEVKGRYPLLGLMGGAAEVGIRSISYVAMRQATPLFQTLEPQIEVANSFALVGLERLEKNFPILNHVWLTVSGQHCSSCRTLSWADLPRQDWTTC
uniref:Perilipin 6 n=1 Tax=Echeneis naucrates TaxID=173247 RepID=A0A665THZ0_ECHNA